jgi:hypothetical protein
MTQNSIRASYKVLGSHKNIVFLEDLDGRVTITNDAEAILERFQSLDSKMRVVYKGTDDLWMEIVEQETWMGKGIGFEPWEGIVWDILKTRENKA